MMKFFKIDLIEGIYSNQNYRFSKLSIPFQKNVILLLFRRIYFKKMNRKKWNVVTLIIIVLHINQAPTIIYLKLLIRNGVKLVDLLIILVLILEISCLLRNIWFGRLLWLADLKRNMKHVSKN